MQPNMFMVRKELAYGARQGMIFGKVQTPNYLIFTRKGCVPTIPQEHFDYLNLKLFHFSYADICNFQDILASFKDYTLKQNPTINLQEFHTLSKYTAKPDDTISYLSFADLVDAKIQGDNKKSVLEIINGKHKQTVTSHDYSQFVSLANPDIYVTPSEVLDLNMGRKRRVRAARQSISFLEHCIKTRKELNFTQCHLIAPVIMKSEDLENCPEIKKLAEFSEVDGYLYCGLSTINEDRVETIKGINTLLKDRAEKVRIYQGDGDIIDVLLGVLNGIDIFESWFPFKLADRRLAMDMANVDEVKDTELTKEQKEELNKLLLKRKIKCIDFSEKKQKELLIPIQKDCECFTCKNHTRAYINHVMECDEVNWQILLTM